MPQKSGQLLAQGANSFQAIVDGVVPPSVALAYDRTWTKMGFEKIGIE